MQNDSDQSNGSGLLKRAAVHFNAMTGNRGALAVMKPPKCEAMEEMGRLLTKIGEMEGARWALKEQLRTLPKRLARELKSPRQRLEAARYLYWFIPDLPA